MSELVYQRVQTHLTQIKLPRLAAYVDTVAVTIRKEDVNLLLRIFARKDVPYPSGIELDGGLGLMETRSATNYDDTIGRLAGSARHKQQKRRSYDAKNHRILRNQLIVTQPVSRKWLSNMA